MKTESTSAFSFRRSAFALLAVLAALALLATCPRAPAQTAVFTNINAGLPGRAFGSAAWGDYDNDGRLDVLLTGATNLASGNVFAQLWRNTVSGFVLTNIGLPGVSVSSAAWGDYDNDGWLDILLTGSTATNGAASSAIAEVWHNINGRFTNSHISLPGVCRGTAAWVDYDNDGRLDILLTGLDTNEIATAQIWRNTGAGFTNGNVGLPGVSYSSVAWGDYDRDGRLDLLLTGRDNTGSPVTQLWRNTTAGFTNINAGMPGVWYGSVSWSDYDNDGWLDILLTGLTNDFGAIAQVWHNTGSGFTNINAGLIGVGYGSAAWGDYNNDGLPDILLTGFSGTGDIARVWRNTGSGFQLDTNATAAVASGLPGVSFGSAAWGDYNNDGRLDVLIIGVYLFSQFKAQVWLNTGGPVNAPPNAPSGLTANVVGRDVILNWMAASDALTPANGLSYNLRVGTSPGAGNIVSPHADLTTGSRRLPARGNIQSGISARIRDLPLGVFYWSVQAIDTAFAGSSFGAEGRFVVYLPEVHTLGATGVSTAGATLHGEGNPKEHDAVGWFEYGLGGTYGNATATTNLGSGTNAVAFDIAATNLLPWMTYHFRAVASNNVGTGVGADATFTVPGPSSVAPTLSALADLTVPQGNSTSIWFTVSPPDANVQIRGNNPVLLPAGSLMSGASGSSRSLTLVPALNHSGSAQVKVTATDGSHSTSRTFALTVIPPAEDRSSLLYLTDVHAVSGQAWRFHLVDAGAGSSNHTVEYRADLSPANTWGPATNVTALGGGVFEVAVGPPQRDRGFYRAKGFRLLMAGFAAGGATVEEGAVTNGPVLVFNGTYGGIVTCIWTDEQGNTWTNQVQVNGTTAVIPVPAAYLSDNATIGQLSHLTLQLQAGAGFILGTSRASTVTIEENDADWQGAVQTPNGMLGFTLSLLWMNGQLGGEIRSADSGFFPTNTPVQLNLTDDVFTLVATNIALRVLMDSPALRFTNYMDLRLDAVNSSGQTNVRPTEIRGAATLVSKVPNRGYLDAAVFGTFTLVKLPTAPSTNEVPLYPVP